MSETKARVIQYVFIITTLIILAVGGWWYYQKSQASTKFQSPQTGSLTNGLQGYWTLDGGAIVWADTTSEVKDVSGNARHINLQIGGDAPTEVPGRLGQGFRFPTTAGTVGIAPSVFDSYTTGTIAMWIKYSGTVGETPTSGTLWGYDNCTSNRGQFQLAMDMQNSTIYLWMTASGSSCTATVDASVTLPNPTDWHHVVFTDDTSGHKLYIDGVLQTLTYTTGSASTDFFFDNITGTAGEQQIGTMNNENFSGTLDEIRLYNRALSATEVASLYDLGKVTANLRPGDDVLEEGLSGYWKLDDGSGTNAADASGNGRTGTLANGPTWTTGRIGSGVDFDGTDDYVGIASPPTLGTNYTIALWAKLDTVGSTGVLTAYRSTSSGTPVYFQINADTSATFVVRSSSGSGEGISTYANSLSTAGVWYHIVGVRSGNTIQVYVNGKPGTADATSSFGAISANSLLLGATNVGSATPSFYFNGQIDEARLYHRALSVDEIRRLYQETHPDDPNANLVGHWTFDGMDVSGTTAFDRGRSGNNGTLTGGPVVAPGRMGQALDFDGSNDYIVVGDPSSLRDIEGQGGGGMSISVWINPRSNGGNGSGNGHIVGKNNNDSGPGSGDWGLSLGSSGNNINFGHSRATQPIAVTISNVWTANQWTHVVVTFNGGTTASTAIQFYINGVLQTHSYDQDGSGSFTSDSGLAFHIGGSGTSWQFDGKIDDVRVYNAVLTQDQVTDIYRAAGGKAIVSSSGNDTLRSGLVGLWSMDGQDVSWSDTTTEVKDDSGNANHGDAIGMSAASATPGRIGQALSFDGSSARVDLFTDPVFDNLDAKTISAWIKPSGLTQYRAVMGRTTWAFQICSNDATDCNGTAGHLVYYHAFSGTDGKWRLGADSVLADQWAHVVVTYDRTSTANDPVIYVNGISQTVTELSAPTGTADSETSDLSIGYDGYVLGMGAIDDVRLYNRGLSPSEVTQLYNMGR